MAYKIHTAFQKTALVSVKLMEHYVNICDLVYQGWITMGGSLEYPRAHKNGQLG